MYTESQGCWNEDPRGCLGGRRPRRIGNTCVAQISSPQITSGHSQGSWGWEGSRHPPGTAVPQGLKRNLSCSPPAPPHWPACMPGQGWPFARTPLFTLQAPGRKVQSQAYRGARIPEGRAGYTKPQVIQCSIICRHKRLELISRPSTGDWVKILWHSHTGLTCQRRKSGRVPSKY